MKFVAFLFVLCFSSSLYSVTCDSCDHILYGLRSEDDLHLGTDEKGASLVPIDTDIPVRFFGCGLTNVSRVLFTNNSKLCPNSDQGLSAPVYIGPIVCSTDDPTTLLVSASFTQVKHTYYVCFGFNISGGSDVTYTHQGAAAILVTKSNLQEYYMPMYIQICVIGVLMCLTALFSGLNLGLMALDLTELQIVLKSGNDKEKKYAEAIIPVRKYGNYLLCTLLLGNVIVNSAISILMDNLTSGMIALVSSTIAIVILGEIIPQSICNRYGLAIGAKTIWVTKFFMVLTCPLSYPISKILDKVLGKEISEIYTKDRLLELIRHSRNVKGGLDNFKELDIISGALNLGKRTVSDIMTRASDIFMVPCDAILDTQLVSKIVQSGFTRIPVYDHLRTNILGLLNVKDLALLDPDDGISVKTMCSFYQHPVRFVFEDMPLDTMLEEFKGGHYHMAFVQRIVEPLLEGDIYYEMIGLVTLEDIIEEIIQSEIIDETDVITDNRTRIRRTQMHDFSYLTSHDSSTDVSDISAQLTLTALQYLSTMFEPFGNKVIAEPVLQMLIKQNVVQTMADDDNPVFLYEKGKRADYFTFILEGTVDVGMGDDNFMFKVGAFFSFGKQMLENVAAVCKSSTVTPVPLAGLLKVGWFTPDFTAKVSEKVVHLRIDAKTYSDALRSTQFRLNSQYSRDRSNSMQNMLDKRGEGFVSSLRRKLSRRKHDSPTATAKISTAGDSDIWKSPQSRRMVTVSESDRKYSSPSLGHRAAIKAFEHKKSTPGEQSIHELAAVTRQLSHDPIRK